MNREPALVIALDVPDARRALTLAETFAVLPVWMKVGLELFTAEGPSLVHGLLQRKLPVFLDLKFHDIPNTVRGATRSATGLGVHMLTLHLAGGGAMAEAALLGRREAAEAGGGSSRTGSGPALLGITLLTSDPVDEVVAQDMVVQRALLAKSYGLDGVVCSGREAAAVKAACGAEFLCLCPGIRFAGGGDDDQARVCTPGEAVRAGADFLVMGRPVLQASNPAGAAEQALDEMRTPWGVPRAGTRV